MSIIGSEPIPSPTTAPPVLPAILPTPVNNVVTWFQGKKTFIALAVGALAILVNHFTPVPGLESVNPMDWISDLWKLVVAATTRATLTRIETKVS